MKKRSLSFGSLKLPSPILYAPLAGCSDLPYRFMSCKYRPGLVYCEMVKIDALVRHDSHTYRLLDYTADMHPIGAQICGSKPKMASDAARIIESLGFDVIDFNCGCPVDKVTKDGSGSGMLKNPQLIGEVLSNVVAAVKIPVTVKIRAGWDEQSINAAEITKIAESAGAKAITVHGRTRAQGYRGPANWDYIKEAKEAANQILVIGNGDVFDAKSGADLFNHTDCDGILVARGTMGQPWIAENIRRYLPSPAKNCTRSRPRRRCRSATRSPRSASAISCSTRATAASTGLSPTTAPAASPAASARWPKNAAAAAPTWPGRRSNTRACSRGKSCCRKRRSA